MNMKKAIANTCRSAHMVIRKIHRIRSYLCEDSTKLLVYSTVLSRLYYVKCIYVSLPQTSLYKLQLAQNCEARMITNTPRHDHITPVLQQLNWLTIQKRCQLRILVFTFNILHYNSLQYICEHASRVYTHKSLQIFINHITCTQPKWNNSVWQTTYWYIYNPVECSTKPIKSAKDIIQFKRLLHPIAFHQI